jgi:5,6-dimethylbenzimidazole synthase
MSFKSLWTLCHFFVVSACMDNKCQSAESRHLMMEYEVVSRNMGIHKDQKFSPEEIEAVYRAIRERRDVRHGFLPEPLPESTLLRLLEAAQCYPSVGLMQPARFILIRDQSVRTAMHAIFERANKAASKIYEGEQLALYSELKLQGLLDSPQHLCVVCDQRSTQGRGLGRQSMPETSVYSVVCAVQNLWLAARAEGVGVGWVSIVEPTAVKELLHIPHGVELVAYLCIGYAREFATQPDLEHFGWETRRSLMTALRSESFDQDYRAQELHP